MKRAAQDSPLPLKEKSNTDGQTCRRPTGIRPPEKVTQRRQGSGGGGGHRAPRRRGRREELKGWRSGGGRGGGASLGEQLLEKALLLGLVVLGALRAGRLLRGRGSAGALADVRVAPDQVHRALDICKHLHLLLVDNRKNTKTTTPKE